MYKLYLCLQYFGKRALAWFAMLGVFSCVFMMLVGVSVMNGFVHKIEKAAKGLFGDVVISSGSLGGMAYYDEFIADVKRQVPAVEGASPFILTFGILQVPGTEYRRTVQVAGIRLPERASVSNFAEGLFVQKGMSDCSFNPPDAVVMKKLVEDYQRTEAILRREAGPSPAPTWSDVMWIDLVWSLSGLVILVLVGTTVWVGVDSARNRIPTGSETYSGDAGLWVIGCVLLWMFVFPWYLVKRYLELRREPHGKIKPGLITGIGLGLEVLVLVANIVLIVLVARREVINQPDPAQAERARTALSFQDMGISNYRNANATHAGVERLRKDLEAADKAGNSAEVKRLERQLAGLEREEVLPPQQRLILGLGIGGLSSRTQRGETLRVIGPGQQVTLTLIPLGRKMSYTDITPTTKAFTVIDDCSTDVASIDSEIVYVDFRTLQKLNNMSAEHAADDPNTVVEQPRCSQIHVKVRPEDSEGLRIQAVARQIDGVWQEFKDKHPDAKRTPIIVETWRQRQSRLVSAMEAQRTLFVIIIGIMSASTLILIVVILYVIVMQKTRDIGVLKAVGASSAGVAGIFLAYGATIALVGSLVGVAAGWVFVHNINPIHDYIGRAFGFVVWSRETFMFEKIPNEVGTITPVLILVGATIAGIVGATIPAVKAARRRPVEALRYE